METHVSKRARQLLADDETAQKIDGAVLKG
jgi:hypothetical protein